jgi:hypothetical protein
MMRFPENLLARLMIIALASSRLYSTMDLWLSNQPPPTQAQIRIGTKQTPMHQKILVVEDNPSLQETLVYKLKRQGYAVETATDGNISVELIRSYININR